jgi:hypothetical protein
LKQNSRTEHSQQWEVQCATTRGAELLEGSWGKEINGVNKLQGINKTALQSFK